MERFIPQGDLSKSGVFSREYEHVTRVALPLGYMEHFKPSKRHSQEPTYDLILKMYLMHRIDQPYEFIYPPQFSRADQLGSFLEQEVNKKKIPTLAGLGFAIQSEDVLNVAVWDNQY